MLMQWLKCGCAVLILIYCLSIIFVSYVSCPFFALFYFQDRSPAFKMAEVKIKFQQVTWNIAMVFPLLLFQSLIAFGVRRSFALRSFSPKNFLAFFESST